MTWALLLILTMLPETELNSAPVSAVEPPPPGQTNSVLKTKAPTFAVRGYLVEGNTVLPPEKFGMLSNYTGSAVSMERLREGLAATQLLYRDLGFVTVSMSLPQQKLTNGIVRLRVTEGKISDITVSGNRYFSSNNIRRALPGLTTNIILNTKWFQPELDQANANSDRQIYPVLGPGPDPGSSALLLKVKDRLPLHGHTELNNRSAPDTPALRSDSAIQYNNLWQLDHQVGLQYNFSPEEYKSQANPLYDLPLVASYSGFYRIPLEHGSDLRNAFEDLPVDFGYDQITHRFNLPAPAGSSEVIVYGSRSTADSEVRTGPEKTIQDSATLKIGSQDFERDLTDIENLGTRFSFPLPRRAGVQSSLSAGIDYKSYRLQSLTTNVVSVDQYGTNDSGQLVLTDHGSVPNANNSAAAVAYLPISFGWSGSRSDSRGVTSWSIGDSVFLKSLSSTDKSIQAIAASKHAGGNFTTLNLSLTREQKLPGDFSLILHANGQWANKPLISNEQFALGGTGSVRGYEEGEEYGDTGWRVQLETRAPAFNVRLPMPENRVMTVNLRPSAFVDYGQRYLLDPTGGRKGSLQMLGSGASVYATVGLHFEARATLGYAVFDTPHTQAGTIRGYFSVGLQF